MPKPLCGATKVIVDRSFTPSVISTVAPQAMPWDAVGDMPTDTITASSR